MRNKFIPQGETLQVCKVSPCKPSCKQKSFFILRQGQRAFTLIEFLVVVGVVGTLGVMIMSIVTSSFRGANKTNILDAVRVSGNQALIQMSKTIGYAESFDGVSMDNNYYTTDCLSPSVGPLDPTPTPSLYKYLKVGAGQDDVIFACKNEAITSNDSPIIDTNVAIVDGDKCWFVCRQDRITANFIIDISFQLKQKSTSNFVENTVSIPFQTSVAFKNKVD